MRTPALVSGMLLLPLPLPLAACHSVEPSVDLPGSGERQVVDASYQR